MQKMKDKKEQEGKGASHPQTLRKDNYEEFFYTNSLFIFAGTSHPRKIYHKWRTHMIKQNQNKYNNAKGRYKQIKI